MSVYTASYLTGYLLVFFTLLALLLVIPQASAAAHRFKPGWRAWVWPLAFLGLLVKNATEVAGVMQKLESDALLWQIGDLVACFSLTMLVINSVHRVMDNAGAHRFTMLSWFIYFLFALAIFWLNAFPVFLIYEVLCTVGLVVFYAMLYAQQGNRAPDAPPVMAGVSLLLIGTILYLLPFELNLSLISINQSFVAHLIQVVAIVLLYKGASNAYNVKYANQRLHERNHPPALTPKA